MLSTRDTVQFLAFNASRRPAASASSREIPVVARDRGIYLPEADLWLDPSRVKPVAFVSHAHSDHFARHRRILCSPACADVLHARYGKKTACDPIPFGEKRELNGHRVELFPAGHALGSAQIRIERLSDGASLVYTGDFKRRNSLSCEPYEFRTADTLILETTFGLPKFGFPPSEDVRVRVLAFCREALDAGDVPVLLGYSFGKAQELMAILHGSGLEAMVHDSIGKLLPVFEAHGFAFPPYRRFDPNQIEGKVLVFPPTAERKIALGNTKNLRTAVATGWAIDSRARYRYRADEAFPLSDHADWRDLLRCVEEVHPSRVLTTHGYTAEFAADLRRRGFNAWCLQGIDQLELPLQF